jgi:hypothetical protein
MQRIVQFQETTLQDGSWLAAIRHKVVNFILFRLITLIQINILFVMVSNMILLFYFIYIYKVRILLLSWILIFIFIF